MLFTMKSQWQLFTKIKLTQPKHQRPIIPLLVIGWKASPIIQTKGMIDYNMHWIGVDKTGLMERIKTTKG